MAARDGIKKSRAPGTALWEEKAQARTHAEILPILLWVKCSRNGLKRQQAFAPCFGIFVAKRGEKGYNRPCV